MRSGVTAPAVATLGPVVAFQHAFWRPIDFTAVFVVLAFVLPGRPRPAEEVTVVEQLEAVDA